MFSAPLMRDEQRLIADTRAFFRKYPKTKSFLTAIGVRTKMTA